MIRRTAALLMACLLAAPALAEDAAPQASPAPQAKVPTHEAHLASYRRKSDAERGWKVLTAAYSSILYFTPEIREVDLPGKGHFFRLMASGDQDVMASLCKSMHEKKLYCVYMPIPAK